MNADPGTIALIQQRKKRNIILISKILNNQTQSKYIHFFKRK